MASRASKGRPKRQSHFNFNNRNPIKTFSIRATISQNDALFGELRNRQCTSCSVVALCLAAIKPLQLWVAHDLDSVIKKGNEVHKASISKFRNPPIYLATDEVIENFEFIGFSFNISYPLDAFQGISPESLHAELTRFFQCFSGGVVTTNSLSVAVVKQQSGFWIVDSHSRSVSGEMSGNGTGSATQCVNLLDCANLLIKNLHIKIGNVYCIAPVSVQADRIVVQEETASSVGQNINNVSRELIVAKPENGRNVQTNITIECHEFHTTVSSSGMVETASENVVSVKPMPSSKLCNKKNRAKVLKRENAKRMQNLRNNTSYREKEKKTRYSIKTKPCKRLEL